MKHETIALEAAATAAEQGVAAKQSWQDIFKRIETGLEKFLFASRWLMAPFYVLMVGSLAMLLVKFAQETWHIATHALAMSEADAVLAVLSLIDITLTGNLMMMVLFAGYENFVSKMDVKDHEDRPDWMGKVDFSGLKLKLIASIVAISGINLLKNFMSLDAAVMSPGREQQLYWMVVIHMVFIASGVMLAVMDKIVSGTPKH